MPLTSVTHLLIHTVSIYRQDEINKGHGRWQNNLVPIAVDIRGRIFTQSGRQGGTDGQSTVAHERKTFNEVVGYLEPTQDVAPEDYLYRNGLWYRVKAVAPPSIAHHLRLSLEYIEYARL